VTVAHLRGARTRATAPRLSPAGPIDADGRPLRIGAAVTIAGHTAAMPMDPLWHGKRGTVAVITPNGWIGLLVANTTRPTSCRFHPEALTQESP